jgi:hypothetical protein
LWVSVTKVIAIGDTVACAVRTQTTIPIAKVLALVFLDHRL